MSKRRQDIEQGRNASSLEERDRHTPPSHLLRPSTRRLLTLLIVVLGAAVAGAFLYVGIHGERENSYLHLEEAAKDIANSIHSSWLEYEVVTLWAHESCHQLASSVVRKNSTTLSLNDELHMCSREEFHNLYQQIASAGLDLYALQYAPKVEHRYRKVLEEDSLAWMSKNHPDIEYRGLTFVEFTEEGPATTVVPERPLYFPVTRVEPFAGNEAIFDHDAYYGNSALIDSVLDAWKPTLSPPIKLVQDSDPDAYSVYLTHPGAKTDSFGEEAHAVVATVVRIPELLLRASRGTSRSKGVYLYDSTGDGTMSVMGGMLIRRNRESIALGLHFDRIEALHRAKAKADKMEHAREQVQRERRINEYMAHEVRNPLASAMAAVNFVSEHAEVVTDEETRKLLQQDVQIVDSSLHYINDLLRSMLDIHRAETGKIKLNIAPTDILQDILEPAVAILCVRGARVQILTECPPDLVVLTDQLRLKQIILNLCINSTKFVQEGFIRLRAASIDDSVALFVEDSGTGVPPEKQETLFESFQDSLDLLNQGTGIGLSICFKLCQLMDASIRLDPSYHSGIEDRPGTRFVVNLNQAPLHETSYAPECFSGKFSEGDAISAAPAFKAQHALFTEAMSAERCDFESYGPGHMETKVSDDNEQSPQKDDGLPSSIDVLFVDDDTTLRRMFIRSVQKVAPTWNVTEASNGERALQLVKEKKFDIIFVDQYMPCIERPLLGTEVVRRIRAWGETSLICGLSANDMRTEFLDAGADDFLSKPFPCKRELLQTTLQTMYSAYLSKSGSAKPSSS